MLWRSGQNVKRLQITQPVTALLDVIVASLRASLKREITGARGHIDLLSGPKLLAVTDSIGISRN
jgi:hypothetical protein